MPGWCVAVALLLALQRWPTPTAAAQVGRQTSPEAPSQPPWRTSSSCVEFSSQPYVMQSPHHVPFRSALLC